MPKIVSLKDNNSIIKYPATISDAVIDLGTGKKLSDIIDSLFDYLYFEAVLDSNISFTKASGLTIDLKYKIDNGKWLNYSSLITLAAGHKVYFKGDNEKISENPSKCSLFSISGGVNVGGNIMSLLGFRSLLTEGSFIYLFYNCTGILSAENLKLPVTTLAVGCYAGMFKGCTSLTTAPQLSASTLTESCYYEMFDNCTSLVTPPQLPATTLDKSCYYSMFSNCTSLTIPPQLPATTLAQLCYFALFAGCTSLEKAPQLPATTLARLCYERMFVGCTSLVTPPQLSATTLDLGCYYYMFSNCTSLEKAPELPATTLADSCYYGMFSGCSKLNYIKALFTTTPSDSYTGNWVYGVASSGTFIKFSEATWNVNGNNGVPANWVIYKSLLTSNQSKIYTNVLRKDASYSSPYAKSYFYFGQVKQIDLLRPSHIKYRVIAYAPGNGNFMLDSEVKWDFGYNGIYKSYYIYNNLSSTSYYPFGYHTLYRSNSAAITLSDGSYFGFYFGSSNSYGQSASTIARTIEVEILECYNCEATLIDSPICLVDAADVPANFRLTSTSVAYNTTNFTAVNVSTGAGLQETGDANSDTVGYSIRTNSYSKPMKSALGYGYRLLFTSSDLLGWVPANNSSSSNATAARTPATDPIDPFGEIVYYSGTAAVAANSRPSATTLWELYTVGLGYSFNTTGAALTLTSWKPVYVKCTPLANGSATLLGYTQDLPIEEDGFIYIYLGVAYSATAVELVINHPVYCFKDGAIRPYGSGNSNFIVNLASILSATSWTADKTSDEVYDAYLSGSLVYFKLALGMGDMLVSLIMAGEYEDLSEIVYSTLLDGGDAPLLLTLTHSGTTLSVLSENLVKESDYTDAINSLDETKEDVSNKVTSISSSSTDTQYPSAKAVYSTTSVLAPKASPALTGTPTAPTAAAGTNTTQIATTAFVKNAVDSKTHYIANLLSGTAANYITEPEFKSVKINGSSTNSASSSNCVLQYDTTNKCLKFIFN